jgi:hypothetical protein
MTPRAQRSSSTFGFWAIFYTTYPQKKAYTKPSPTSSRAARMKTFLNWGSCTSTGISGPVRFDILSRSELLPEHPPTYTTVRANKSRTPIPSEDASRPSFDTIAAMMNDTLDTGPPSHTTAKKTVGLVHALFSWGVAHRYGAGSFPRWTPLRRDQGIRHTFLDRDPGIAR